jgi:Ca-activated chloride channel family protein
MARLCRALGALLFLSSLAVFVGCGDTMPKDGRYALRDMKKDTAKKDTERKDGEKYHEKRDTEKKDTEKKDGEERDTESYARIVENPFHRANKVPLSTFSVDVDTASYSNVRRFLLQENRLPPADAVRIEEMVNYFPYAYLPPKGDAPVGFTLELGPCPWNAKHHLARIGLAARKISPSDVPPRNLVFLVDTSGSMDAPNRLPLLQSSLKMLVAQLGKQDRVAIVAYAGSAGLVLGSTPGNQKKEILAAIDKLHARGSTNGGEGIVLAYKVAEENFIKGGVNRVILGTDGDFNVGVTSQDGLVRLIEKKRKSGVFLTILGFGMGNLKDSTLEKLAHHGNGHYAYIDGELEARKVFVEQGAALVTVAKDVKLQVVFNPRRAAEYRLIGYENRLLKDRDFDDDKKDAGDMGSGHTVTALYEIIPTDAPAAAGDEWLTVKMRYKDPEAETSKLVSQGLFGVVPKLEKTTEDFRFAAAVASFGMLLRDSKHRGDSTFAKARALVGKNPGGHRTGFLELVDAAAKLKK